MTYGHRAGTTHVVFDRITLRVVKRLPCPRCGRSLRRERTFYNTVSPFNKNADGTVRTPDEIRAHLAATAAAWQALPEAHVSCDA